MTDDWRLENLLDRPELMGITLVRKPYRAPRPEWDHDHCAACWTKIAEPALAAEDVVHEGYATAEDFVRGADDEWICVSCFERFAPVMKWRGRNSEGPGEGEAG